MKVNPKATRGARAPVLDGADGLLGGMWPRSFGLWLTALYLALFIIRPWELLFPELGGFYFERWMVIVTVVGVFFLRGPSLEISRQTVAALLLLAVVWMSSYTAVYPELAIDERVEFFGTVLSLWIIIAATRTPYQLMFLVTCFLVATGLYLGKSEWEYFFNGASEYRMGVYRLVGTDLTFGGPNELAAASVVTLPFAQMLYLCRDQFCATWSRKWRARFSLFLLVYGGLAVSAILLTRSRAGTLAAVFFVLVVAWQRRGLMRKINAILIGSIALLIVFAALPTDMRNRLRTVWNPQVESTFEQGGATTSAWGRWYGFLAGIEMFRNHPVQGVGIGNFKAVRLAKVDGDPMSAHNLPGELLAELGLLGAAAFLFFIYALDKNYRLLQREARESEDPQAQALGRVGDACQTAMLLMFFTGLSDHNLQHYQWMWIAGFALVAARHVRRGVQTDSAPTRRRLRVAHRGPLGTPAT